MRRIDRSFAHCRFSFAAPNRTRSVGVAARAVRAQVLTTTEHAPLSARHFGADRDWSKARHLYDLFGVDNLGSCQQVGSNPARPPGSSNSAIGPAQCLKRSVCVAALALARVAAAGACAATAAAPARMRGPS